MNLVSLFFYFLNKSNIVRLLLKNDVFKNFNVNDLVLYIYI